MDQHTYIQICVTDEQKFKARELVQHSLHHHHTPNIWDRHAGKLSHTRMMRFTGTLGEIVFADAYHLPRPTRSFGAADGQDWGQDFEITTDNQTFAVDIKAMKRKTGILRGDYVLNIPASQLHKPQSRTTYYFCISFHQSEKDGTVASFIGFIDKEALYHGQVGHRYCAGTTRVRQDRTSFTFHEDTYEVLFRDIIPPIITDSIRRRTGYRLCHLQ